MTPDNDVLSNPTSATGATPSTGEDRHARDTPAGYAVAAVAGGFRRVSDIGHEPPGSPLATIVEWIRTFLAQPHPDVGRSGPVCPFTPPALAMDTIWLTEVADRNPDSTHLAGIVEQARERFLEIEPREGAAAMNKAMLIVLPHLDGDAAALVDEVQKRLKPAFVDQGLMLGEFHARNESPGLRNPEFRPLRSPVPMLAIRHMVETDLPFLKRGIDPPQVRVAYLRSYLRRLGGSVRRNYFDQAIAALLEAQLELLQGDAGPSVAAASGGAGEPAGDADRDRVAVVGGGPAGALLALALARRGHAVDVYERRPDPRVGAAAGGRSINLGLSKRGIQALTEVGLIDAVMPMSVAMHGRVIHAPDGGTRFQPYGKDGAEVLHSIDRNELNHLLLDHAGRHPGVRLHFDHRLVRIDKERRELELETGSGGRPVRVRPGWVVGADGAFSRTRQQMQRGERADFRQEYLEWGYKELTLAALPGGRSQIELEALHVWPRLHGLFVSHPNRDGSHTLTLFLPFEGPDSFATVRTADEVRALFDKYFPDLVPLLPNLAEEWERHPTGSLTTTRTAQWHYQDWMVLIGDACHAVYPFYGQGMNSAFEDCSALMAALSDQPDRACAFRAYEHARRPHTDILAELSKANFIELKQKVKSPWFVARKRLDVLLNRLLPKTWLPLYTMIAHTTMPYGEALARARRQDRILLAILIAAIGMLALESWLLWR